MNKIKLSYFSTALFLLVVVLDQFTKQVILDNFYEGQVSPVIDGLFNLTLAFNKGVAFGFLSELPDNLRYFLLSLFTVVALVAVSYFILRDYKGDKLAEAALILILGGAVGNIIDRVFRGGAVVDFLDFYLNNYHWPAFNLADSAICLGVTILVFRKPVVREVALK